MRQKRSSSGLEHLVDDKVCFAGNLSLRDHSDVHNREVAAPAAPPQFSAVSEP